MDDVMITVFGDGRFTSPTTWWAATGGYGVWLPGWNLAGQNQPARNEATYFGPGLGQTSTSTRQELAAWLCVLALPIRSNYATDSASMFSKVNKLIEAAAKHERSGIEEGGEQFKARSGRPGGYRPRETFGSRHGKPCSRGDEGLFKPKASQSQGPCHGRRCGERGGR